MAGIAVVAFLVAASPLAGPEGLTPGTVSQFVVKTAMGAVVAGGTDRAAGAGPARHPASPVWAARRW